MRTGSLGFGGKAEGTHIPLMVLQGVPSILLAASGPRKGREEGVVRNKMRRVAVIVGGIHRV